MKIFKTAIFIVLFLASFNAFAAIILVPATYTSIQNALNAASSGDTILVSPGVYYENIIWPEVQGLKLLSSGDSANTIIDASHSGRPITFTGHISLDSTTIIKGFTIKNGRIVTSKCLGGGIYLKNASIRLEDLHICNNTLSHPHDSVFGGGIFCLNCSPVILNSQIDHNTISGDLLGGGGIECIFSNPEIVNSQVNYNYLLGASYSNGGGIACYSSSPVITYSSIDHNYIRGGDWMAGAGICLEHSSNPSISYSQISDNDIADSASWCYGGGLYSAGSCNPVLKNVTVHANRMGDHGTWHHGGGLYIEVCNLTILENVTVDSNYTGSTDGGWNHGGGIYFGRNWDSLSAKHNKAILTNVKVINNIQGNNSDGYGGGGIYIEKCDSVKAVNLLIADNLLGIGNSSFYDGAGIFFRDSGNLILINSTIANNRRSDDGSVDGTALSAAYAKVYATNCIFCNPGSGSEFEVPFINISVNYSDIRGSHSGLFNINAIPMFYGGGDYHLLPDSPCIGKGSLSLAPVFDIENNLRPMPVGTNPDMGAFEDSIFYATSINDQVLNSVELFPNPAREKFTIEDHENKFVKLAIYNVIGELMLEQELDKTKNEIAISALATGMYIVVLTGGDMTVQKKMIKE